ncbi:MAG TPA: hypothetical protein VJR23_19015 [Candidatus Acidoferrales bacterium]|nr:hypothetical protein [Candidatus Acidoferrales bacterium]
MNCFGKLAVLAAIAAASVCAGATPARAGAVTCDDQTIAGSYGFRLHELVVNPTPPGQVSAANFIPGAFVGRIVFNSANGTVSGFRSGNEGSVPTSNNFNTKTQSSSYLVASDCSGTLNLILDDGSSRTFSLSIVNGGAEIEFALTAASMGVVSDGFAMRQPASCDATTIAGNFGVRFNRLLANRPGVGVLRTFLPADSVGTLQLDATTNPPSLTGQLTGITDGTSGFNSQVTGTYSLSSNCTGSLILTDSEQLTKSFEIIVVLNATEIEIEFANTSQPADQIVGEGVAKPQ